nr:MAG TPA: hypothetical protein [Caudoviricetes sp.]
MRPLYFSSGTTQLRLRSYPRAALSQPAAVRTSAALPLPASESYLSR